MINLSKNVWQNICIKEFSYKRTRRKVKDSLVLFYNKNIHTVIPTTFHDGKCYNIFDIFLTFKSDFFLLFYCFKTLHFTMFIFHSINAFYVLPRSILLLSLETVLNSKFFWKRKKFSWSDDRGERTVSFHSIIIQFFLNWRGAWAYESFR